MIVLIGTYRADKDMMIDCLQSITDNVKGEDGLAFIDDSGDADFRRWLADFGTVFALHPTEGKQGFAKAMVRATGVMNMLEDDYVAWWEEDFTATEFIDLEAMALNLEQNPDLAQIVLVRQPWFPEEIKVGSMLAHLCDRLGGDLVEQPNLLEGGPALLKHQMIFSSNPGVWAPSAYRWGWPDVRGSEERKTRYLVEDDDLWFAYWGHQVTVRHEGERSGRGY